MKDKESVPELKPDETLALICPYDGIGGARVAFELLKVKPALYITIENDIDCVAVVERTWPEAAHFEKVEQVTENQLRSLFAKYPKLTRVLLMGGPPCQPFSGLSSQRAGFQDPRSNGISDFVNLVLLCLKAAPHLFWDVVMENVASMSWEHRTEITKQLESLGVGGVTLSV